MFLKKIKPVFYVIMLSPALFLALPPFGARADSMQKTAFPDPVQIGHMNPDMHEQAYFINELMYDSDPVSNHLWMQWGFAALVIVSILIGLLAAMLLVSNRRLKKEASERKQIEASLKLSEEKFFKAFHHGPTIMTISSIEDGKFLEVNENFVRMTGYCRKEAIGTASVDLGFISREDCLKIRKGLAENGFLNGLEFALRKKSGDIMNCLYFAETITIEGKQRLLSIASDITERKQAEEALQESETRFRTLFENAPAAIQGYGPDGTVHYWNRASEDLYGYTKEEAVGNNLMDLIIPPEMRDHVRETIRHAAETGEKIPSEALTLIRKDGSPVPVFSHHVVLKKNGKTPELYCLDVNLTLQKRLRNRLEQARKAEAISALAGGIAHQFNNVLSGITGNLDLLETVFPDNEDLLRYTGRMQEAALRMTQLTGQLVAYARGGKYQPETLSVHDFVSSTLPLIRHAIDPAVKVQMDLPADSGSINADPAQMQMVLMAVLANASEAMEGKGMIRITGSRETLTRSPSGNFSGLRGDYIRLSIADDGKGMDEETRERIFEPFFTTRFIGRGLGMAAVYGIIKNHNGWIFIDSRPGKGTTVNIYLPAVEDIAQKYAASKPEPVKGSGTILIIEDEKMVMDVNRALLTQLGYHVLEAGTGREAIDLAETFEGDIDMALLDIVLPDMDGKVLYPLLMEARPGLKVIVCSGYSIDGPAREILDAGADDFIQKPFGKAALSEKLKKVL